MNVARWVVASFIVVSVLSAPIVAAEVTGELVDRECYLKDKATNVGPGHQDCATLCALKGQPLAVVTAKGEVYEIAGEVTNDNNAVLMPHMSHRVVLTGEIMEKDGKRIIVATEVRMAGKPK